RYQRAGGRAVILEVSGRWMEAAEAWRRAACIAPRTDWQQFARKRAEHCHRRCRGRV
ncbi:ANR family transcriptional regulator, partial [Escherichia coli]|nr:ANR family transcriptional regulator [Escherichia coli]